MNEYSNTENARQDRNLIAPSEKHLEDYIWAHPETLGYFDLHGNLMLEFKFRQFKLPSGIVDLMGKHTAADVAIMELKKGEIDARALAQVMRYMQDVQGMLFAAMKVYEAQQLPYYEYLWNFAPYLKDRVMGFLVGSSINKDVRLACHASRIVPLIYQYDGDRDSYQFEILCSYSSPTRLAPEMVSGEFGQFMYETLQSMLYLQHYIMANPLGEKPLDTIEELVNRFFEAGD